LVFIYGIIHNKITLKEKRKELRNNSTYAEIILWTYLKKSGLEGRKFRRQHSIGNYIADFYCPQERLIIELDGESHFTEEGLEKDKIRTEYFLSLNIKVVRFENQEVLYNTESVLKKIVENFKI